MNLKGLTICNCVKSDCFFTLLILSFCFSNVPLIVYFSSVPLCCQIFFGTGSPDTVDIPLFNHSHAKVDLPGSLTLLYENVPEENMYQVCLTEHIEGYFRISPPCINFKYNQTICRPQDHESCLPATLVYETGQSPIFGLSIWETTSNTTKYVLMDSKSAEYDIYQISPTEFSTLSSIWYDGLGCSFKVGNLLALSSVIGFFLLCCGCYYVCFCCHFKSRRSGRIGVLHEQQRRDWEEQIELVYRRSVQKMAVEQQEETNATASSRIIVPKLSFFDSTDSLNSVGSRSSSISDVSFRSSTQSVNSVGSGSSISAIEDTNEDIRPPPFARFGGQSVFEVVTQQERENPNELPKDESHLGNELDLPSLKNQVVPMVAAKMKQFGIFLGVKNVVLDKVKMNYPMDCERACEEMLKLWLAYDNGTGKRLRTWDTVIDSLEKVELKEQAQALRDWLLK